MSGIAFRLNRPFCFQHHIGTSATGRSGRLTAPLGSLVTFHTAVAVHVTFRVGINELCVVPGSVQRLPARSIKTILKPFHRTLREGGGLTGVCVRPPYVYRVFDCDTPVNTLRSLMRL